jgi:hypothetical protein
MVFLAAPYLYSYHSNHEAWHLDRIIMDENHRFNKDSTGSPLPGNIRPGMICSCLRSTARPCNRCRSRIPGGTNRRIPGHILTGMKIRNSNCNQWRDKSRLGSSGIARRSIGSSPCNMCHIRIPDGTCRHSQEHSQGRMRILGNICNLWRGSNLGCSLCSRRHNIVNLRCNRCRSRIRDGTSHRFQEHSQGCMRILSSICSPRPDNIRDCNLCNHHRNIGSLLCSKFLSRILDSIIRHPQDVSGIA